MEQVTEYDVFYTEVETREGLIELVELVNEAIKAGWRPQGGIAIGQDGNCMQAMVR